MLQLLLIIIGVSIAGAAISSVMDVTSNCVTSTGGDIVHGLWFFRWQRWRWNRAEARWLLKITLILGWPLFVGLGVVFFYH